MGIPTKVSKGISIHALREEGDGLAVLSPYSPANFYPRPPRGGRRYAIEDVLLLVLISIHALREEGDRNRQLSRGNQTDFYPRPPRGGRLSLLPESFLMVLISIHALREEGDTKTTALSKRQRNFYPRPPRGGRPGSCTIGGRGFDFYPRPPRGGRLRILWDSFSDDEFLSTPSARRATLSPFASRRP